MCQRAILLAVVLVWVFADCREIGAQANPSDQNPQASLALHNLAKSQELLSRIAPLYDKTLRDTQGIVASRGKAKARQLADAYVALRQLERGALDLQMHGETAGSDYALRVELLKSRLQEALSVFLSNPANRPQLEAIRQNLQRLGPNIGKALRNVDALINQQKWDAAHNAFQEAFDQVMAHAIFLAPQECEPYMEQCVMRMKVIAPRNVAFRQQVQSVLEQAGTATVPDTQGLLAAVAQVGNSLKSSPAAELDGQSLSGPQCLDHFFQQWQAVQLAALRCRAIDWARHVAIPQLAYLPAPSLPNRVDDEQYARFCAQLVAELADIIAADAQRATDSEAPALYAQYLDVLGKMLPRSKDDRLEAAVQPALDQLVAKSPELAEQVAAYRAATGELLRWRERVASEAADAQEAQFPSSDDVMRQAFTSRNDHRGLLPENDPSLPTAKLLGSAPEVLATIPQQVVQRSLRIDGVAGLPGGKLAVTGYVNRHYATLPRPPLDDQISILKRDLLVGNQTPPLSLAAAAAIGSAEQGDLLALGGTVDAVFLEGLIPRFATLPAAALPITPLGPLPVEGPQESLLLPHVAIRLQMTPTWVCHRYFFLEMPAAAAAGSND